MTEDSGHSLVAVKVVVALPDKQVVKDVMMAKGATVANAIEQSEITGIFEALVIDPRMVGDFRCQSYTGSGSTRWRPGGNIQAADR